MGAFCVEAMTSTTVQRPVAAFKIDFKGQVKRLKFCLLYCRSTYLYTHSYTDSELSDWSDFVSAEGSSEPEDLLRCEHESAAHMLNAYWKFRWIGIEDSSRVQFHIRSN